MKSMKNERGATLILVLFGVTLVTLFMMFLMVQLLQTKTQITYAEENIDSKNLAQMGIDRYKVEIAKKLNDDIIFGVDIVEVIETSVTDVDEKLGDLVDENMEIKVELDDKHSYLIHSPEFNEEIDDENIEESINILEFQVTGTAFNTETNWNGQIIIQQEE